MITLSTAMIIVAWWPPSPQVSARLLDTGRPERLPLEGLVLVLGDVAAVQQPLRGGDLVGRTALAVRGDRPNVPLEVIARRRSLLTPTFGHVAAFDDQV